MDKRITEQPSHYDHLEQMSIEQLTAAEHTDEIGEPDAVHVRIDYKVSGIGSASCGPALDEKYCLCEKKISFAFTMGITR